MKKTKILITGAAGFIGSHLVEHLLNKNYKVIAFDRYNINNDWGWLEGIKNKKNLKLILGDIRDYDSVYKAVKQCDVVFHLAALIGIPYSYVSPTAYVKTNIEGTLNILEASKNLKIKQILITSTSEVYGTAKNKKLKENDPLVAQSPYAASKIGADQLALSYFKSFNLPVKIVRPFNTYGPRQSSRAIIPTILSQILSGKTTVMLGNKNATRDFTYVKDTCEAFEKIYLSKKFYGEVVNVGSNQEILVTGLVEKISRILNIKIKIKKEQKRIRPKLSEVERLRCDNSKIIKNTSWSPRCSFKNGIINTIDWMKNYKDLKKVYKSGKYTV
jgi:NAD dependent epimerase/dehydratase